MSDDAHCDVCRRHGRRRRGKHCPEGWFYGEFVNEDDAGAGPVVVIACSTECRDRFWLQGPGDLRTSPSYIVTPKANRNVLEAFDPDERGGDG